MKAIHALAVGLGMSLLPVAAGAEVTGVTGGGLPQGTVEPSLGVNYIIRIDGDFNHLGDVDLFAGNFAPGGYAFAQGQLMSISQNTALFSVLGTTYGGNGVTTFALPNLSSRAAIGAGAGPGLTARSLGETTGVEAVSMTVGQLPAHDHTLSPAGVTSITGGGQAIANMQPSLGLNYLVPLQGIYPTREGGGFVGAEPVLGQVRMTARSAIPNGWALAQGQLLPINQNTALFSILGTTYGGNGMTTFALPDLRGRAAIGAGMGQTMHDLGEMAGVESVTLGVGNLPAHGHGLPPSAEVTGMTGGGQAYTNMQPTLALNYVIATQGIFPSRDGGGTNDEPLLGQIGLFAGNFAPGGWMFADGRLLSISQNTALFSLLGTMYGGDGKSTFALPDLRGALAVGAGQGAGLSEWVVGQMEGSETNVLTVGEMAGHVHEYVVPEPGMVGMALVGLVGVLGRRRRG